MWRGSSNDTPCNTGKVGEPSLTTRILIHVDPEMARRLKHLAVERDTTLQALGIEAFTRLLGDAAQQ